MNGCDICRSLWGQTDTFGSKGRNSVGVINPDGDDRVSERWRLRVLPVVPGLVALRSGDEVGCCLGIRVVREISVAVEGALGDRWHEACTILVRLNTNLTSRGHTHVVVEGIVELQQVFEHFTCLHFSSSLGPVSMVNHLVALIDESSSHGHQFASLQLVASVNDITGFIANAGRLEHLCLVSWLTHTGEACGVE